MTILELMGTRAGGGVVALITLFSCLWMTYRYGYEKGQLSGYERGLKQGKQPIFLAAEGTKIYRLDDKIEMVKDMNGTSTNNSEEK